MSGWNAQWSLFWILLSYMYCRLSNIKPAWIVKKKSGYIANNLANFSKKKEHTSVIPSTFIHFTFFNNSKIGKISIVLALKNGLPKEQPFINIWLPKENLVVRGNWTTANFELWTGICLVPNFTCVNFSLWQLMHLFVQVSKLRHICWSNFPEAKQFFVL